MYHAERERERNNRHSRLELYQTTRTRLSWTLYIRVLVLDFKAAAEQTLHDPVSTTK